MSRARPLAPSDQKKFMSFEELAAIEASVSSLSETIQTENPSLRKDTISQPRSLANLVLQLQLFMDQSLGEKVRSLSTDVEHIHGTNFYPYRIDCVNIL